MSKTNGVIQHRKRAQQINDFSGLQRHRGITPTDIDGVIDYNGNAFMIFEVKYNGKELDYGQKLALEHMIDSLQKKDKPAVGFVLNHEIHDPNRDVDVANDCTVREIYFNGRWRTISGSVIAWIGRFEKSLKDVDIAI